MAISISDELDEVLSTDDVGSAATITGFGTVNGVLSREAVEALDGTVESHVPVFTCKLSDVSGIAHGTAITIGGVSYTLAYEQQGEFRHSTRLMLEEVDP